VATNYDILELEKYADAKQVKLAYRKMAKRYHPDVSDDPDAEHKFKRIQLAYSVLSHPQHKKSYDRILKEREDMVSYKKTFETRYDTGYYHPKNRIKVSSYFIKIAAVLLVILCGSVAIIFLLVKLLALIFSSFLPF